MAPERLAELVGNGLVVIPFNPNHAPARPAGHRPRPRAPRSMSTWALRATFRASPNELRKVADQPRVRRRRPDGPEHGRRPAPDPQGHPRPDAHAAGDGADLPGGGQDPRPAGLDRRHDRSGPLRGHRVPGPRGRRLHDRPLPG
ncbi:MAG: hypothetical protein MZV64_10850 [Ignavibacteriales bacterium]|nr:hypothetical protein [Ignavibacteriales bacterium]